MKPFDLEKAKAGEPVATTKGEPVRIVCWDRKYDYPIVALVEEAPGQEYVYDAKHTGAVSCVAADYSLHMVPVKRTGWLNIYEAMGTYLASTKEQADSQAGDTRVACVEIEWEE